jgi:hypothetical protein
MHLHMQTHTCYGSIKIKLQCVGDRRDTCRHEQMHMRARGHEAAPCNLTGGQYSRDILHLRTSAALGNCNSAMSGDVMIPIPQGRMVLDSVSGNKTAAASAPDRAYSTETPQLDL